MLVGVRWLFQVVFCLWFWWLEFYGSECQWVVEIGWGVHALEWAFGAPGQGSGLWLSCLILLCMWVPEYGLGLLRFRLLG